MNQHERSRTDTKGHERAQASTIEDWLACLIAENDVIVAGYSLLAGDRAIIVKALKDRARWMSADVSSGERRRKPR